ncbi:MAG: septum formation protein Maf [Alphaproteobacteria bacterium]|nr:septum formation protein Maf [Alphaproteobacteria bacterium]
MDAPAIVLASASESRLRVLRSAGVTVVVDPAAIDEETVKESMFAEKSAAEDVTQALADLKVRRTSSRHPGSLVVGADQMLFCAGRWFDKPTNRATASAQLAALAGRTHHLITAACAARDGTILWRHVARAALTMRSFSPAFLERYLDDEGDAVLMSVGSYRLEGRGAQLFSDVKGDFFTILGLPLLPLLEFLRAQKILLA